MISRPEPAVPFYLPVGSREIFCLHHAPAQAAVGALVYVPPFAEEMNKSRRMAALQSRALVARGWHVLQIDPSGTGDSGGDFSDATWDGWLEDVEAARRWLFSQSGFEPWLWGLRLGGLLASMSLSQRPEPGVGLVLWQPVVSGRQHLQQFLRLKAGSAWLGQEPGGDSRSADPLDGLRAGEKIEVAGYLLSPSLALPMAAAELQLSKHLLRVVWLEVSPRPDAGLATTSQRLLSALPASAEVRASVVAGPSFWRAQEIEVAPELVRATCDALLA